MEKIKLILLLILTTLSFSSFAIGNWLDEIKSNTPIKANHVMELRAKLHLRQACLLVPPTVFTDPILTSNTPIKAIHIEELRKEIDLLGPKWVVGNWGACTGGTGAWIPSGWGACTGGNAVYQYTTWGACSRNCGGGSQTRTSTCGFTPNSGTQTRTNTCVLTPDSGTQTRTVRCMSGGLLLSDSKCGTTKPAVTQFCTPTNTSLCGANTGSLSQSCTPTGTATCTGNPINSQSCNTQNCCTTSCYCPGGAGQTYFAYGPNPCSSQPTCGRCTGYTYEYWENAPHIVKKTTCNGYDCTVTCNTVCQNP